MNLSLKNQPLLALTPLFAAQALSLNATTLTFPRSQSLEGWHERVFTTVWEDFDPDVKSLVSTDANGDLRGFNHPTATVWLQSPEFVLGDGPITISSLYLLPGTATAPGTDADISGTKTATGWAGIALRDTGGILVFTYSTATE